MKKMKKFVALTAAASLAVAAFAGCAKSDSSKTETKENATNAGNEGSTSTSEIWKIGSIGPTTGGAAIYGNAVKNGAQIAVDEINAAGGINGSKIELFFEDDQADPELSVNAYNALKDKGIDVLLGTVTSGACEAVVGLTADDKMFQLTPSASAQSVIEGDNVFQVCFTDPNQGSASAQYIGENKLATKVGIIYDSSDVYSTGIFEKFVEAAASQDFEVVSTQSFTKDTKTDFSVQVQACKDAEADLVFLPIYYTEASLILTEADKIGFKTTFFGCDGLDGVLGVENFDTALAEGVMLLTPFSADSEDAKTSAFVKSYKEKYNDVPNQFAADAYDGVYIIKAAIEKSGVKPDASLADINEALKKAMTEISVDGITGSGMTWSATGEVNKAPMAVVIKDGTYVSAK